MSRLWFGFAAGVTFSAAARPPEFSWWRICAVLVFLALGGCFKR